MTYFFDLFHSVFGNIQKHIGYCITDYIEKINKYINTQNKINELTNNTNM